MAMSTSPAPEPVTADALRATTYRLARRLNATQADGELSQTHRSVLARLDLDGNLSGADIARAERITPQAAHLAISALVDRGLVERHPDPQDGRRRVLALTDAGRQAIRQVRNEKNAWLEDQLARLTAAERKTLGKALNILTAIADAP